MTLELREDGYGYDESGRRWFRGHDGIWRQRDAAIAFTTPLVTGAWTADTSGNVTVIPFPNTGRAA